MQVLRTGTGKDILYRLGSYFRAVIVLAEVTLTNGRFMGRSGGLAPPANKKGLMLHSKVMPLFA